MKTIEINLYKFDELLEKAQQKAIEELFDINVDYNWWEFIYEDAKQIGLEITSFDLDRSRHAKGEILLSAVEVAQNILSSHGESCETYYTARNFLEEHNTVFADYMDENSKNYESANLEYKLIDIENDFIKKLLDNYSIILQNECDYLRTREAIIETIKSNDYDFTENGKLY